MGYYPGVFGGNVSIDHLKKNAPVTLIIIGINLTIFVLSFILRFENQLIIFGGMPPIAYILATGEYWRLLTSMFIHSGIMHVIFNMVILLHAGGYLEQLLGQRTFVLFYFLSGLLVSVSSGLFTNTLSVGASGAIFALLGFILYFDLMARKQGRQTNSLILPLVLMNMVFTVLVPQISFVGHFSGLVIGYIFASYQHKLRTNKTN
ncbi:MAG: hypothetical protein APF76_01285 [Desulfitibacter sp. BRH_c19]|nr:MAG: hypothetical protein APF76_01285 [Desulfitibacter sp. BRH_c19]